MKLQRRTKIIISVTIALLIVALLCISVVVQANKPVGPGRMTNCNIYGGTCETNCEPSTRILSDGTCKDNLVCCKIDVNKQTN